MGEIGPEAAVKDEPTIARVSQPTGKTSLLYKGGKLSSADLKPASWSSFPEEHCRRSRSHSCSSPILAGQYRPFVAPQRLSGLSAN
jgi:hypothetical protein